MDIAVGVTTAPRGTDYLSGTLRSLRHAGFEKPLVVNDVNGAGPYRNFKATVRKLLDRSQSAEAIAVFQDDILVSCGARDWLNDELWPDIPRSIGVLSIYCAATHQWQRDSCWFKLALSPNESDLSHDDLREHVAAELRMRGLLFPDSGLSAVDEVRFVHEYEDRVIFCAHFQNQQTSEGIRLEHWRWYWFQQWMDGAGVYHRSDVTEMQPWAMAYGACAFIMPRSSAGLILERCTHPESKRKTDIHVAEFCHRNSLSFWMHTPSLVQHVGLQSTGTGLWELTRSRSAEVVYEIAGAECA